MLTYNTARLSRPNLQDLMAYLDENDIEYTYDHQKDTITFNMTELDLPTQRQFGKLLGDPIQESKKLKSILRPIRNKQLTPTQVKLKKVLRPIVESILHENNDRILKMVSDWNKNGRVFSNVNNIDDLFFKKINTPIEKLGITSQGGDDILYYDTKIFSSDRNAIRNIKS